ncbi:DUF1415 domain-containing protein [Saccharobesus litoralis]|uniref:DUF1415 domain-containing protein n=1 Tax=Saccharobesus litoralis TaxID=2172099 RepID=A0A2S0VW16_9ALTE|nr:DUF1415 domain-containing protein [Saccharobesus litoralis]AWB68300.1 DUF1415 domain-containing protein [Saccharobesus litoralis]
MSSSNTIHQAVEKWLLDIVIGLNLCPFAAKPQRNGQIDIQISQAKNLVELNQEVIDVLIKLDEIPAEQLDTLLLVVPRQLRDFYEYNDYLDMVDQLIEEQDRIGVYQVASFHPEYRFDGTVANSVENLTNKAPYPILHFIREDSLAAAVDKYPNPEQIPEDNIEKMHKLSKEEIRRLFPYIRK